jgi:hypothetical protein
MKNEKKIKSNHRRIAMQLLLNHQNNIRCPDQFYSFLYSIFQSIEMGCFCLIFDHYLKKVL